MKKKVWFFAQYAAPLKYGFGTAHFSYAKEFVKRGFEVVIFASSYNHDMHTMPNVKGRYDIEVIEGVTICWLKALKYKNGHSIKRILNWFIFSIQLLFIPREVKGSPGYIIVSSQPLFPILNAVIFKIFHKVRIVFEIRDIWPLTLIELGKYSRFNPLIQLIGICEKIGYRYSDSVISTLPNLNEHINNRIGREASHFKLIPQGYDNELYDHDDVLPEEYFNQNFPVGKFFVAYTGAISVSNPLHYLISSAAQLEYSNPNIHFLILGEGVMREQYECDAKNLSNITFLNKIPRKLVYSFLSRCDLLFDSVLPLEIYKFGLSRRKWIDYMMAGKPIISMFEGYKSIINQANCGSFIKPGNIDGLSAEIKKYYSMPLEQRNQIGKNGLNYVRKHHSFDKLSDEWVGVLNSIQS